MKRWKKVLIWTLSVIVVLGVGGLFAANYAVDKLMNSMADGFDVEAEDTVNVPQGQVVEPTVAESDPSAEPAASVNPTSTSSPGSTPASTAAGEQTAASTTKPATTPAPVANKNTDSKDGYTSQVSTDKAKEIQESVTVKDKANVASIVIGKLSVSDIKRLQELAEGGLTVEDKWEARKIILGKVSEEQYNELSQVAKKYGVSQGKTRAEILADEQKFKEQNQGSE